MLILLSISGGLNIIALMLLVFKQTQKKGEETLVPRLIQEIDYLRARIRGFQQYATKVEYDGEHKYLVQTSTGRFDAAYLPKC